MSGAMRKMKIHAYIIIAFGILMPASSSVDPLVTIKQGTLRGFKEKSLNGKLFYSFTRIPYAEPPVGILRFRDPVPAGPWNGIRLATEENDYCLQFTVDEQIVPGGIIEGSEDCLYLNVYTPNFAQKGMRPVMVYFFGSAFKRGDSKAHMPHLLLNEDVVVVTFDYRLNVFGFLETENEAIKGKLGIKDAAEALKWIQQNIFKFGGDPKRVTIFGHSSGAIIGHYLSVNPMGKGLFQRAILLSGTSLAQYAGPKTCYYNDQVEIMFRELGCNVHDDHDILLSCMQEIDAIDLLKAFDNNKLLSSSGPSLLDDVFYYNQTNSRQLRPPHVDIITGYTREDGAIFSRRNFPRNWDNMKLFLQFTADMNLDELKLLNRYYNFSKDVPTAWTKYSTDSMYSLPVAAITQTMGENSPFKLYTYVLNHKGQYKLRSYDTPLHKSNWITHGEELFYLFWNLIFPRQLTNENDLRMRDIYLKLFTNFAKTGNPTPDDSLGFIWAPSNAKENHYLSLEIHPKMVKNNNTEKIKFWSQFSINWLEMFLGDEMNPITMTTLYLGNTRVEL